MDNQETITINTDLIGTFKSEPMSIEIIQNMLDICRYNTLNIWEQALINNNKIVSKKCAIIVEYLDKIKRCSYHLKFKEE